MTCTQCNAPVGEDSGRFCSHCGTVLPDADRISPYEYMTHADRFASVQKHRSYSENMNFVPKLGLSMSYFSGLLIMGIGTGFFLFTNSLFSGESHSPPVAFRIAFAVVPLIFVLVGISLLVKTFKLSNAPLQRRIATVVDERVSVTSNDNRSSTAYFCTLQFEGGDRLEMKTKAKVAGLVTRGDIGIVYTKLDHLIDFRRVAV